MAKVLTVWIPTFRREKKLSELLLNIEKVGIQRIANVVISDNDSDGPLLKAVSDGSFYIPKNIGYRYNKANLSAGVNFLRAFEYCETPWLMIVGDDDLFLPDAVKQISNALCEVSDHVVALKFDSSLYGSQPDYATFGLEEYVNIIPRRDYPNAFNNLCLISNWLFRCDLYREHLASAYFGYSSKVSHLLPALKACSAKGHKIHFSKLQPVDHGISEDSWPKAATWFEMVMTISNFTGFLKSSDRKALLRLLLHSDFKRNMAKCLRVHQFYGDRKIAISAWNIHLHLALISGGYRLALLVAWPLLCLPSGFLPRFISDRLGEPGSVDRW